MLINSLQILNNIDNREDNVMLSLSPQFNHSSGASSLAVDMRRRQRALQGVLGAIGHVSGMGDTTSKYRLKLVILLGL